MFDPPDPPEQYLAADDVINHVVCILLQRKAKVMTSEPGVYGAVSNTIWLAADRRTDGLRRITHAAATAATHLASRSVPHPWDVSAPLQAVLLSNKAFIP